MREILLYHVSDFKVDILDPEKYDEKCICLSEGCFVGSFGQWIYIFRRRDLLRDFSVSDNYSGGAFLDLSMSSISGERRFSYCSQHLKKEFRIYKPIIVEKYAVDVVENFNILKGHLKKYLNDVLYEELDIDLQKHKKGDFHA